MNHTKIATNKELPKVLSLFLQAPVLCDSDKFSFCILLDTLPENSQELMTKQLGMNMDQDELNQAFEDAKPSKTKTTDISRSKTEQA